MTAYTDKSFTALAGASYINIAYREWGDCGAIPTSPSAATACPATGKTLTTWRRNCAVQRLARLQRRHAWARRQRLAG